MAQKQSIATLAEAAVSLANPWGLHIEVRGQGRPLVMLHNGFDSLSSWDPVASDLARAGWRVIAWDRRGYGRSFVPGTSRPEGVDMVAEGSHELDLVLSTPGVLGNATQAPDPGPVLVGHCMGGAIALDWALTHRGRCAGLVLEATGFHSDHKIRRRTDWVLQSWENLDREQQAWLRKMHGCQAPEIWELIWPYRNSYVMQAGWDQRPRLSNLDCPVLVIQGDKDFYFSPDHAREAADRFPDCRLTLMPGIRHDVHQEATGAWLEAVQAFLAGLKPPASSGIQVEIETEAPLRG